ncbi:MAG: hypothetical protein IJT77_03930 [Clostridia bacterium]|nr:hypothetical protein [Clostridia bacterium]
MYGSELAAKYYKKRIDLSPTADEKARILEIYANFLKEYCLVPDEEADKIKASRWSLPGLTPAGRVSCYFEDLKAVELQSEKKAFVDKILAEFKDNAELRIKIYRQCWRIKGPAFLEKVVFSDPAVRGTKEADNPGFYKDFMREYDNRCFIGRYAEVEKFLASEEERTLNAFRNAKSESGVMAGRLNAARNRVDSLRKDEGNTHDALRNAGNNKVQRENLQKRIGDLRSQLDQAQKAESEAVTALRAADTAVKNALIRYEAVMDAQIRYFDAVSIRHYDSKNPVTLKKAIAAVQRKLDVVLPFRDDMYKVDCTIRMMNLAYAAKDDELVLRLAASIEKTIKDNAADTKNRWAYVFQDKARVVQKILALVAYRQEDYEKCIALTTPLLPFEKNWGLGVHELYEPIAKALYETSVESVVETVNVWKRGGIATIDDLDTVLTDRISRDFSGDGVKAKLEGAIRNWLDGLMGRLENQLTSLCLRCGVPPEHMSLNNAHIDTGLDGVELSLTDAMGMDILSGIMGVILAVIGAALCGGGGIAIIGTGPVGMIAGASAGLLIAILGKSTLEKAIRSAKIPVLLRSVVTESAVRRGLARQEKTIEDEIVKALADPKNGFASRLTSSLADTLGIQMEQMARNAEMSITA